MRRSVPKVIAMIAVGLLCVGGMLFHHAQRLQDRSVSSGPPPAAGEWVVGAGMIPIGGVLIFTAALLDRKPGTKLAISLMAFGSISFVLALAIAHTPMLMSFGVLGTVFGAIIGLIAILFQNPSSKPRRG